MESTKVQLLTIIADEVLESRIIGDLLQLGARGYTASNVRGAGTHSVRTSEWEGENVRIDTLVPHDKAHSMMEHLSRNYFRDHHIIIYCTEASVLRADKFV